MSQQTVNARHVRPVYRTLNFLTSGFKMSQRLSVKRLTSPLKVTATAGNTYIPFEGRNSEKANPPLKDPPKVATKTRGCQTQPNTKPPLQLPGFPLAHTLPADSGRLPNPVASHPGSPPLREAHAEAGPAPRRPGAPTLARVRLGGEATCRREPREAAPPRRPAPSARNCPPHGLFIPKRT